MAVKKKKMVKAQEECSCGCEGGFENIEPYLLIFIAGVGLVDVLGMISFPPYVPVVLFVLAGVLGVKKLIDRQACGC